jgi:hypothetical protein
MIYVTYSHVSTMSLRHVWLFPAMGKPGHLFSQTLYCNLIWCDDTIHTQISPPKKPRLTV